MGWHRVTEASGGVVKSDEGRTRPGEEDAEGVCRAKRGINTTFVSQASGKSGLFLPPSQTSPYPFGPTGQGGKADVGKDKEVWTATPPPNCQ